jgi:atypical dual specificity phosphatase
MMALIARLLFFPTLWWNRILRRLTRRRWWDWVDDSLLLGALPSAAHVDELQAAGIGAVINTCQETCGPVAQYQRSGIEQLHLPTVDFTPPRIEDIRRAVGFIHQQIGLGRKVYVHCKAGRGRSATVVMCYLISKGLTPEAAQALLKAKRPHVLSRLAERPVVRQFARECAGAKSF